MNKWARVNDPARHIHPRLDGRKHHWHMFAHVYLFAAQQPFIPTFKRSRSAHGVPWRQFCHVSGYPHHMLGHIYRICGTLAEGPKLCLWRNKYIFKWKTCTASLVHPHLQRHRIFECETRSAIVPLHAPLLRTEKHTWSQNELHLEVFFSKMERSSEVASQFGSHEKVALTSARSR